MDQPTNPEIVIAELAESTVRRPASKPYGVPRRFGVGTILIVTAAYGVLLAILRLAGWPPGYILWALAFISVVGLGQMFWFGSKRPREASIVTGAVVLPVFLLVWSAGVNHYEPLASICCGLVCSVPFGGTAGYLAGGVVAGVFLIMDAVEQALDRAFPRPAHAKELGPEGTEPSPFSTEKEKTEDGLARCSIGARTRRRPRRNR